MVCGPWHCRDLLFPDQILRSFRVDRDRAVFDRFSCGVQDKKRSGAFGTDGGTGRQAALPNANRRKAAGELRLAAGTTLEIDVRPDGGVSIFITAGK